MSDVKFDLKWAQTLDGQLCDDRDISQWITGQEELRKTHMIRREYDAILVGAKTFLADLCQLTVRHVSLHHGARQPVRLIFDRSGLIQESLKSELRSKVSEALSCGDRPTVIFSPKVLTPDVYPAGVFGVRTLLHFGESLFEVESRWNNALLAAENKLHRPLRKILVEGGPSLLSLFLKCGLFDRLFVSIAPCLTGGTKHRLRLDLHLANAVRLEMQDLEVLGSDIFMRAAPIHRKEYRRNEAALP